MPDSPANHSSEPEESGKSGVRWPLSATMAVALAVSAFANMWMAWNNHRTAQQLQSSIAEAQQAKVIYETTIATARHAVKEANSAITETQRQSAVYKDASATARAVIKEANAAIAKAIKEADTAVNDAVRAKFRYEHMPCRSEKP